MVIEKGKSKKKDLLKTKKRHIIRGKAKKREFLTELKNEIVSEIFNYLLEFEKENVTRRDILESLMTRIDYFIYIINHKIDMSKDIYEKKGLHNVRFRYSLLVDEIIKEVIKERSLNQTDSGKEKLTIEKKQQFIQRIEELAALHSSILDGEIFIDNMTITSTHKSIDLTFHLDDYNLIGFQQENPFYDLSPADRQQLFIPDKYKESLEKAVISNKWLTVLEMMKNDGLLKEFHRNSPIFEEEEIVQLTKGEEFNLLYNFITLLYYFAGVTRLIINEINKQVGALRHNKIFTCTDSEILKFLEVFSSRTATIRTLNSLITFEKKFRRKSLMNFSPFFRIDYKQKWYLLPNFFMAYYKKIWDNFIEIGLTEKRLKGKYFEDEVISLFKEHGFHVWAKEKTRKFNELISEMGSGDVDIIIQENMKTLWLQAKSTYNNLKSYRNLIRKGRNQLISAIDTYHDEVKRFSKEFNFLEINAYVVTPSALPYRFAKADTIGIISLSIIDEGLKESSGEISLFMSKVGVIIKEKKNIYKNMVRSQTAQSKNKIITVNFK